MHSRGTRREAHAGRNTTGGARRVGIPIVSPLGQHPHGVVLRYFQTFFFFVSIVFILMFVVCSAPLSKLVLFIVCLFFCF